MIRKAKIQEVPEIRRFLVEFSQDGGILPRTLADLYGQLRDYYVYREDQGPILGIAALHICWAGLGEIRSVAVVPTHRNQGIASRLVETCLAGGPGHRPQRNLPPHPAPGLFPAFRVQARLPGRPPAHRLGRLCQLRQVSRLRRSAHAP